MGVGVHKNSRRESSEQWEVTGRRKVRGVLRLHLPLNIREILLDSAGIFLSGHYSPGNQLHGAYEVISGPLLRHYLFYS